VRISSLIAELALILTSFSAPAADWKPAAGRLMTRWSKDVSPESALPEYPRPQMVREQWLNLNGLWDYAVRPKDEQAPPNAWDGRILVPFPIESALSGVMKNVGPDSRLWYRRTFQRPADWKVPRTLLHFGAVDWDATVWVNGKQVATHRGGYDPFSCDVTDALKAGGEQELVVRVSDPTDASHQPRGKQVREPRGIWYTAVTGIWQTVWLEPVPDLSVQRLTLIPDFSEAIEAVKVSVETAVRRIDDDLEIHVLVVDGDAIKADATIDFPWPAELRDAINKGAPATGSREEKVFVPLPKLWSPENPFLYRVEVELRSGDRTLDHVTSYVGMRKIEVKKDDAGVNRLFLNNEPLFQYGPLDQGWWPDGLYTAPTDEALKYDIEMTKKLGFNMCRKHVKVEPERWYYWCDKLGLLVWQDMPSGDRYIRERDPDIERSAESEANFRREWQAIIEANRNHPSIVCWVPFNEGWGQFKTNEILAWTKELDPTRLVDGPSGWSDRGGGDMHDMHRYPGPGMYAVEDKRASVLGEFGGLGLPVEGHTWLDKGNWGYRSYTNREDLERAYETIVGQLPFLIADGLAAAVYTQTTDVEIEVNGLMTYDRAVTKFDVDRMAEFHKRLYSSRPATKTVVPTSEESPQTWRYTTTAPAEGWERPDFDAAAWKEAPGGFGEPSTPGSVVRTQWKTNDIWLRRMITLDKPGDGYGDLYLRLHHDEEAEIYVNGVMAAKVTGYSTSYVFVPMDDAARRALKAGKNTLAVHCRQTGGGQYVDVGVVEVKFGE
jgi:hypothetical protein